LIDWLIFILALAIVIGSAFMPSAGILARMVGLVAVMLGATIIVSGSLRLIPGDPIDHILGDQAQASSKEMLAKDLGLMNAFGKPTTFVEQYAGFFKNLASNQVQSFITRRNALDVIFERLPYTIFLATAAMLVAVLLGPLLGVLASGFPHRWPDFSLSIFALLGISVPSFFLGPMLILLFAIKTNFLPVSGADEGLVSVILPALSLGTALAAMLARMSRASMLEVAGEDFVRTALAKGLSWPVVFFKHMLKNALIPVVTLIGLQFGAILAGTVVTEKIFNWPGIGLLLLESIQRLDMPLVQTCVLVIAFIYGLINLLTDVAYGLIDPRIRIGEGK
jgi:peptide/nickel transport system permease protein